MASLGKSALIIGGPTAVVGTPIATGPGAGGQFELHLVLDGQPWQVYAVTENGYVDDGLQLQHLFSGPGDFGMVHVFGRPTGPKP